MFLAAMHLNSLGVIVQIANALAFAQHRETEPPPLAISFDACFKLSHYAKRGGDQEKAKIASKYFPAFDRSKVGTSRSASQVPAQGSSQTRATSDPPPLQHAHSSASAATESVEQDDSYVDCNIFEAVERVLGRASNILDRTAVAGAVCAPHGSPVHGAFFDVDDGEGFIYADQATRVIFRDYIQDAGLKKCIFYYDIACQYSVNFAQVFLMPHFTLKTIISVL